MQQLINDLLEAVPPASKADHAPGLVAFGFEGEEYASGAGGVTAVDLRLGIAAMLPDIAGAELEFIPSG